MRSNFKTWYLGLMLHTKIKHTVYTIKKTSTTILERTTTQDNVCKSIYNVFQKAPQQLRITFNVWNWCFYTKTKIFFRLSLSILIITDEPAKNLFLIIRRTGSKKVNFIMMIRIAKIHLRIKSSQCFYCQKKKKHCGVMNHNLWYMIYPIVPLKNQGTTAHGFNQTCSDSKRMDLFHTGHFSIMLTSLCFTSVGLQFKHWLLECRHMNTSENACAVMQCHLRRTNEPLLFRARFWHVDIFIYKICFTMKLCYNIINSNVQKLEMIFRRLT
jgi:hypothetical protein